jgi:hypothetical protein
MPIQLDTGLRTDMAAKINDALAMGATLTIYQGALPANCAAADPAGALVTINLPDNPLNAANGQATLAGSWTGAATLAGTAASFRIHDSSGACRAQGGCAAGATQDGYLILDSTEIAEGQTVNVVSCTLTLGGD